MVSREINKLKKQKDGIVNKNYSLLSDKLKEKCLSRIDNIDFKLNKLKQNK